MIQLSSSTIMVLHPDTTTVPLDTEEIRSRIFRACVSAGEMDSWIADDLSLAVEFSLLTKEQRMIRVEELNQLICTTLEDSGFPAVALEFKRSIKSAPPDFLAVSEASVRLVLNGNLALDQVKMERIVPRILKSLELLGIENVSRNLILELGRQFRDTDFISLPPAPTGEPETDDSIVLRKEDLEKNVSPETAALLRSRVLRLSHVSRLFSVLRLEISLTAFSELNGLEKPVTELSFWSISSQLTGAIDEICRAADAVCSELGEEGCTPLPLSLTVCDAASFAGNYMNASEKHVLDCARGLLGALTSSLSRKPFKVQLQ